MDQGTVSAAQVAAEMVANGMVIGLGSGRAASAFVRILGERVANGLHVRGVPTSRATQDLARSLGISLAELDSVDQLDLAIDGADEVDPGLNLIKGLGGALVREKVVASIARRFIVLVGEEKLVPQLGSRGVLPVEVVPFARGPCSRAIQRLGFEPVVRLDKDSSAHYVTDNGNLILDLRTGPIRDLGELESRLLALPGVVGTGLFLGMADEVFVDRPGGCRRLDPPREKNPFA